MFYSDFLLYNYFNFQYSKSLLYYGKLKKKSGENKNKLKNHENLKNSKPRVQPYRFLLKQECSTTWTKCCRKKLQHAKSATGAECKTKTLQRVKVKHEIEQYIKECNTKIKYSMKRLLHKKVQHVIGATWKKCSMKKYKFQQWNKKKVHKNSEKWITGCPLTDRYTLVSFGKRQCFKT